MVDNKDIKHEEFIEILEDFGFPEDDEPRNEPQIYFADDLISIYSVFKNQVYNPQSVLYPSCGFDASPARVFDNVTFVDIENGNGGCVNKLQQAGLHALKQDIKTYTPKNLHDFLILLNPSIPTEWASRHLKSGGYVLANDYHSNATEMYNLSDQFVLWGVMDYVEQDRRKKDYKIAVSRNLEDLFQPVKDAAEFHRVRPYDFESIVGLVNSFVQQGIVTGDKNASFEQKWKSYRETMQESMPYKRVAERYIFVKK